MYVTAIVPAHNEAGNIKRAVRALKKQVDKVIVVCDRCDDDTYQRAQQAGARAFETVHKMKDERRGRWTKRWRIT